MAKFKTHQVMVKETLRLLMSLARHDPESCEDFWNRSINHRIIGTFLMCAHFKILHEVNPDNYTKDDDRVKLKDIHTACHTHWTIVDRTLEVGLKKKFIEADEKGLYASAVTIKYANELYKVRKDISIIDRELPNG